MLIRNSRSTLEVLNLQNCDLFETKLVALTKIFDSFRSEPTEPRVSPIPKLRKLDLSRNELSDETPHEEEHRPKTLRNFFLTLLDLGVAEQLTELNLSKNLWRPMQLSCVFEGLMGVDDSESIAQQDQLGGQKSITP